MNLLIVLSFLLGSALALQINKDSFQPIIERVNSRHTTWKADPHFPRHITISSFKRLLGAKKSEFNLEVREKHSIPDSAIPDSFDARKAWTNCPTIKEIRDQGNCGSCWAVAASAAFSDRLCISKNGSFTTPLSGAELLSCCDECGDGCDGGYPEVAWDYFASSGIVTGGEYESKVGCQPYPLQSCEHHSSGSKPSCSSLPEEDTPLCEKKCSNSGYTVKYEKDHHYVKKGYSLRGVKEIQKDIMTHGPVEAAFSVFSDFPTYKSGVYKYTEGEMLGGHAVRVIGWGTEEGTPYWLIANSWNSDWGDKGTFKILRGSDECGIESGIVAGVPK